MQEKVKGMLKNMSMPKKKKPEEMPEGMVEGEAEEGESEGPELELSLEDMGGEGESEAGAEMPEESSALAEISDEDLMAELKKRGIEVASGGASITPLPEAGTEGEEMPAPRKPMPKMKA